jgi:KDO2-lipid IV(A) lauroyltransferase
MKPLHIIGYFFVRFFGILPFRLSYSLGYLIGLLYWQLGKRDRRIAIANIRHCFPKFSNKQCQIIARKSLINTAINVMESAWVWQHRYPAISKKIVQIDNLDLVKNYDAAEAGTVFVTAHFGHWELFGDFFIHHCNEPLFLGKETGVQLFDNYIKRSRERSGSGTVFPCTREGLTQLYTLTGQGKSTALIADQEPAPKNGIFSPFFGQAALSSLLVQDMVQKVGAKVVGMYCQRLPKGRGFRVSFFEVEKDIYSPDIQLSTAALNRCYERIIKQNPEQYTWNYKRFNNRPVGEPSIY